jgi:hypothetical protein
VKCEVEQTESNHKQHEIANTFLSTHLDVSQT